MALQFDYIYKKVKKKKYATPYKQSGDTLML